jgi:hypothetical protein
MFTKTDLAKFENVFDEDPKWVNLGGQKNFAQYAGRIGKEGRNPGTTSTKCIIGGQLRAASSFGRPNGRCQLRTGTMVVIGPTWLPVPFPC